MDFRTVYPSDGGAAVVVTVGLERDLWCRTVTERRLEAVTPELVQLGEPEAVSVEHDHHRGLGYVYPDLDHGRAHEHVDLPVTEAGHLGIAIVGTHAPVHQTDPRWCQLLDEAVHDLLARSVVLEPPGVDVRQDLVLAQVVPAELGHVGVHELVVGDAVAHGIGQGHVAQACHVDEAGCTQL